MRIVKHKNNTPWRQAKQGEATAEQIAAVAKTFQKADANAWAVAITEGEDWISADHIRRVVELPRAKGAVAVWVSDGLFAQCVWRKSEACTEEVDRG